MAVSVAGLAHAATYYVDHKHAGASDDNAGTSESSPWKTIGHAMGVLGPGDHLYIKGGTSVTDPGAIYDQSGHHGLAIVTPGAAGNAITIEAYPGDTVVLQGSDEADGTYGIDFEHASYHTIRGLTFRGFRKAGYGETATKRDILIEHCAFRDCPVYGIRVGNLTNFTIRDVQVSNCYEAGVWVQNSTHVRCERVETDSISGASDGFVANYVDDAAFIHCVAHASEDGFDLTSNGVMIDCQAYGNTHVGVKLWRRVGDGYAPKAMTLINCLIHGNGQDGIRVSEGAEMRLYNSVLYDNGENGVYYPRTTAVSGAVHSKAVNNVIAESGYNSIYVFSTAVNIVDANHNCLYHNQAGNVGLHSDASNVTSDPLLLGPSAGMFQLRSASPAVDAGVAVAEVNDACSTYLGQSDARDYDGAHRPRGAGWDIGAYEKSSLPGNTPPTFTAVPNPPPARTDANEGDTVTLQFMAADPEGHALVFFLAGGDIAAGMTINQSTGLFSWTPSHDQGGGTTTPEHTYDIVVGVTDQYYADPPAEAVVRIVVHNVNRVPSYNGLSLYTLVEGRPWMFSAPVSDADGDTITHAIQDAPAHLVLDDSTGVISWTPVAEQVGSHVVHLTFSDGVAQTSQTITFEVLPQAPYQVPTDESKIFYVDGASGSDTNDGQTERTAWKTISRAVAALTAGQMVLIRAGTYHEGSFTPRAGTPGNPIIYKAYPGESVVMDGGSATNWAFTTTSHLVWDGITFSHYTHPLHAAWAATHWTIVNCTFENVGDVAIYGWTRDSLRIENTVFRAIGNQGLESAGTNIHLYNVTMSNITDRGINLYNPATDNVTIVNSEFTACGHWGLLVSGRNAFVYGTRVHDNGQVGVELCAKHGVFASSSVWNTSLVGDIAVDLYLCEESDSLILDSVVAGSAKYGIQVGPLAHSTMRDTAVMGNATANTIVAQDGSLTDASSLPADPNNHAPVLAAIGDQNINEKALLRYSITAADSDGDALTFSAINLPTGASFDPTTRLFAWTPANNQDGIYHVAFRVSDGKSIVSQPVVITVHEVANQAAVLAAIEDKSLYENALLSFQVSATDSDGDAMTYSVAGLPGGAGFIGQTFSWRPTYDQAGVYSIVFAVSDGESTDAEKMTITVVDRTPSPDVTGPVCDQISPEPDALQIPVNPVISLALYDGGMGVDANTVTIHVNDQLIYTGNSIIYNSPDGVCRRTDNPQTHRYYFFPNESYEFDQTVPVLVNASDKAHNVMTPLSYHFTTEMRSFGRNELVSSNVGDSGHPAIATDSHGNIWAAWHTGQAGACDIYVAARDADTRQWSAPVRLTNLDSDQRNPVIAVGSDDRVYVAWQDNRRGNWDIYVDISLNGTSWLTPVRVSDPNTNETNPAVAIDRTSPNLVYIAWQQDDALGNEDIYVASSSTRFTSKAVSQVTSHSADQTEPALVVASDNTAYVVWTDQRSDAGDIYGASSASSWNNVPIVTGSGNQHGPAITVAPGTSTLHVLWMVGAGSSSDILYGTSIGLPAAPISGSSVVDDAAADPSASAILAVRDHRNRDHVFACWQDNRNVASAGDRDLYFAEIRSGTAGTNVLVGDNGANSNQHAPALGFDRCGEPVVLWGDDRGTTAQIYGACNMYSDPVALVAGTVPSLTGGRVGPDPAAITSDTDVSIAVVAAAMSCDVTLVISEIRNAHEFAHVCLAAFEIGPSGIQFTEPATVAIPYLPSGSSPGIPYWYNAQTGLLSQEGITGITYSTRPNGLSVVSFDTTHLTPFYVLAGSSGGGGGGGGGGGCALSLASEGGIVGYLLPYVALLLFLFLRGWTDRRRV